MEPPAKKLRGWRLERSLTDLASTSSNSSRFVSEQSALATKLLHQWACGALSATAIRDLAHCALLDGAQHPELASIASCGNCGEHPGNCHRDLMTAFVSSIGLCGSIPHKVPLIDPKTTTVEMTDVHLFLPHLVFHSLLFYDEFSAFFSVDKIQKFWEGVEASGDPRLQNHPLKLQANWSQKCIPLFVHGDGVEFQTRDSLMVWSWGSLLSTRASMDSSLLLTAIPKSCTTKVQPMTDWTWHPIWKQLKWSFSALLAGVHPLLDADGSPLDPGSPLGRLAGQPLHPEGLFAVIWAIEGDHEFFSNHLLLPHWQSHRMCWECNADTTDDRLTWKKLIQPGWTVRSCEDVVANPPSQHLLFQIPGVSSKHIAHDALHIIFNKGVLSHLLGSVLRTLCWHGLGRQSVSPDHRLGQIFNRLQHHYKALGSKVRLTNLRLNMFVPEIKSPHANWPSLSTKAGESKHLLGPLLEVQKELYTGSILDKRKIAAMKCMLHFVNLLDEADVVLSELEADRAINLALEFLGHYSSLNAWAIEEERKLFHIVPKFHMFHHLALGARYLNPRIHWTFKSEDYVGRISKLAASIAMGVKSTNLSHKLCLKYRHMLHFRLTRTVFED